MIFCLCIDVRVHVCVYVCACMRVYVHVLMYVYAYMCACVYPACSWLAPIAGVGGYVLTGVRIGGLPYMCLYFCGC